jgi:5-formyltetrahydrofolate cyclo-ligase
LAARTKDEWRRRARANRSALRVDSPRVRFHLSRFIEDRAPTGWVVTFDPMPGEIDLTPLRRDSAARFALTRTPSQGRALSVHPCDADLEDHPFGYRQPVADSPVVPDDQIDIVLVPGLAFDHRGHRLGFGAGYYDRFLARLRPDTLRIGITDGLIVSELPAERHDIAMTHLAGETGVVPCPFAAPASPTGSRRAISDR